jgi:phage shock protein C
MFCTKCGTTLNDQARFCSDCGAATGVGNWTPPLDQRLSRSMTDYKIAGVCAGLARYLGADVTLVRVLWVVAVFWPIPLLGLVAYFAAWILMPKDPLPISQASSVPTTAG